MKLSNLYIFIIIFMHSNYILKKFLNFTKLFINFFMFYRNNVLETPSCLIQKKIISSL